MLFFLNFDQVFLDQNSQIYLKMVRNYTKFQKKNSNIVFKILILFPMECSWKWEIIKENHWKISIFFLTGVLSTFFLSLLYFFPITCLSCFKHSSLLFWIQTNTIAVLAQRFPIWLKLSWTLVWCANCHIYFRFRLIFFSKLLLKK